MLTATGNHGGPALTVPHKLAPDDIIDMTIDWETREIHVFANELYLVTIPMAPQTKKLWPAVTFYNSGGSVDLLRGRYLMPPLLNKTGPSSS